MTTNYTSLRAVLYDLSLTISDKYWNETKMLEWLHKGLRQVRSEQLLQNKVAYIIIDCHKAILPTDLKYLTQVAYNTASCSSSCLSELQLPEGSQLADKFIVNSSIHGWHTMRMGTSPFHSSICKVTALFHCSGCEHEFTVDANLILTTTVKDGILAVAYMGYALDDSGCAIIPDDEDLKEALLHFVLYRYWLSKYTMMEDGAETRMKHHLSMWQSLSIKAGGNLTLPDVSEMENLKNQFNRLVPTQNRYNQGFQNLGAPENVNF